jgi:hypothetical protein
LHAVNNTALPKHTQAAQRLRNTGEVSNCFLDMRVLLMAFGLGLIAVGLGLGSNDKSTTT